MKSEEEEWRLGGEGKRGGGDGETEVGDKRRGRYSHVINVKWWQSVGGGGKSSFTAHYRQSASCWGEEWREGDEEKDDTWSTPVRLLILRAATFLQ